MASRARVFAPCNWLASKLNRPQEPSIKLQLLSDLHLETFGLYESFLIPPCAPYLLLAGDIGRLSSYDRLLIFVKRQCVQFKHVYYILGNHEFYGSSRDEALDLASKLAKEPDLHGKFTLLNRTRIDLTSAVSLLGCTLHSYIPEEARNEVEQKINDFRGRIIDWTVAHHNKEHESDVNWLKMELENIANTEPHRSVVVATHYAPSHVGTSEPKLEGQPTSTAFSTDLLSSTTMSWKGFKNVKFWVFGHTHWCCDFVFQGVRVVANQHGYFPSQKEQPETSQRRVSSMAKNPRPKTFDVRKCITIA